MNHRKMYSEEEFNCSNQSKGKHNPNHTSHKVCLNSLDDRKKTS